MNRKAVISTTVTVPAESLARTLQLTPGEPVPRGEPLPLTGSPFEFILTPHPASEFPLDADQRSTSTPPILSTPQDASPNLSVITDAAAVLKRHRLLESVAPGFVSVEATIRESEEGWILESSEFAACKSGKELFAVADDIASRINRILALYCDAPPVLFVEHCYFTDAQGKRQREIRGSLSVDVVSSKGLTALVEMKGTLPLGSKVFQAMMHDHSVNEALILHGETEVSWFRVYDLLEFLGSKEMVEAGWATGNQVRRVRQTANYYRHLGGKQKYSLPSNPPTLTAASEFVSSVLKKWMLRRLTRDSGGR
jgi:hypothetical protein